ncbi:MAG: hypothetical protein U9N34_02380, partial [Candidatus Cloacimonadota bacterium]|nr:hypothetical protein [Candidatus Cloacimonadota bacterium]
MYRKVVVITQMMLAIFAINANSIFSFKKFPVRSSFADVYSIGMGGVGIGDLHRINSNQANPSLTISTKKVTFSSSVELGYNLYSDNQNSFTDNTFDIPYFNIIVPVINNRFFFNFNKYLSGNLKNQIDTDSYTEKQIIDSYLYNADIGYAYHHKIVNLGISSRFYMGHFTHYFEQDFVDEEMADTNFERYNELKSVAIN